MKKLILFISLFAFNNSSAQDWQWAKNYGGPGNNEGISSICLDSSGNVYATGWFQRPHCIFGSDTLFPLFPYESQRLNDYSMFILKVDNSGKLIWCKGEHTTVASGTDIKYDPFSNAIYVASYITFESLHNFSQWAILEKRDLNGNIIWSKGINTYPNGSSTSIYQMTLDNYGNIYFLGWLQWNDKVGTYLLPKGTFLAKYNSNGDCIFAKNISSIDGTYPQQIKYTNSSLIVLGWSYNDTVVVDTAHEASHGTWVSFISRFDTLGNIMWLKPNGGPNIGGVTSFDTDSSGNIYGSLFF